MTTFNWACASGTGIASAGPSGKRIPSQSHNANCILRTHTAIEVDQWLVGYKGETNEFLKSNKFYLHESCILPLLAFQDFQTKFESMPPRPPVPLMPPPVLLCMNIFNAILPADSTASLFDPLVFPWALCWSNNLAASPIAIPMKAFCCDPCPAACPPVNIFKACIAAAEPMFPLEAS